LSAAKPALLPKESSHNGLVFYCQKARGSRLAEEFQDGLEGKVLEGSVEDLTSP
jgi:hypothetical protein